MNSFDSKLTNSVIGVAGDWHGDLDWALKALDVLAKESISKIIHLGDFGILPDALGAEYIKFVSERLVRNKQELYVVPGNHEDYVQINSTPFSDDGTQLFAPNLAFLPRNFRWTWGGHKFVVLGGANSINYESLTPNVSWWREEAITLGDLYNVANDGEADVMFAHEAPSGVVPELSPSGWTYKALAYAEESSALMLQAMHSVKPALFMHGHYHKYYDKQAIFNDGLAEYSSRIVGLDMNGHDNNLALLNVETLELQVL